jgi:2-amino-4-hydroxy-6-hydroxymethyldihydropteridine diphosphokinase
MKLNNVYLLLGSNMLEPEKQLELAKKYIQQSAGKILHSSSLYRTAAWGKTDQPDFLNQVLQVQTKFNAEQLLKDVLGIEEKMGRIRTEKNAPRIIDIDILFFNEDIISSKNLTVPHPEIYRRRFVLTPLAELSPDFIHPVLHKNMQEMLDSCSDELNVQKI